MSSARTSRVGLARAVVGTKPQHIGASMNRVRRMLQRIFVVVALVGSPAWASTNTSELTDMWWSPGESGWGVNVVLQHDVAFLTFFVYDANANPVWYTSDVHLATDGTTVWSGKLYATNGPWFGGPFNAGNVHVRQAGTASFAVTALNQATLTYTVDNVTVTKALERQTWANEDYTGSYLGGYSVTNTSCTQQNLLGVEEAGGVMSIQQNGNAISLVTTTNLGTCTYTGTYSQTGKLGQVVGNYTCANGVQGQFALIEMNAAVSGFSGRIQGVSQFCQYAGTFGGVRRAL
jgi:hypothetical protein